MMASISCPACVCTAGLLCLLLVCLQVCVWSWRVCEVYEVHTYMGAFSGPTRKAHLIWSNHMSVQEMWLL